MIKRDLLCVYLFTILLRLSSVPYLWIDMINWILYKLYASIQTTFNFVISSKVEAHKNEGYITSRCNGCHRIWWADLLSRMGYACKIFSYVMADVTRFNVSTYFPVLFSIFCSFNNRGCIQEMAQTDVIVIILLTKIRDSITPTLQLFATEREGKMI